MRYLYLDNFRGFQNTFIPLKDVNFLVGENSTGKTSVMAALNLFTQSEFWLKEKFNSEDFEFGNFEDIVSASSKDMSYFSIGYIDIDSSEENKNIFCLHFENSKNLPKIKSIYTYHYLDPWFSVVFHFEENRTIPFHKSIDTKDIVDFILNNDEWKNTNKQDFQEYFNFSSQRFEPNSKLLYTFFNKNAIKKFIENDQSFDTELGIPRNNILFDLLWIAPLRAAPKKTYDTFEFAYDVTGKDIPFILRNIYSRDKDKSKKIIASIEEFGKESGLFKEIRIKELGDDMSSPFQLQVVLNNSSLNLKNVGYGVSQSLPILINFLRSPKGHWHAVQQPEVHLHPKAQAALGGLIYQLSEVEKKSFLIETHSDHIIDRFRLSINKSKKRKNKPEGQILFFDKDSQGNKVYSIDIDNRGRISDNQPESYRDFFIREELNLLRI